MVVKDAVRLSLVFMLSIGLASCIQEERATKIETPASQAELPTETPASANLDPGPQNISNIPPVESSPNLSDSPAESPIQVEAAPEVVGGILEGQPEPTPEPQPEVQPELASEPEPERPPVELESFEFPTEGSHSLQEILQQNPGAMTMEPSSSERIIFGSALSQDSPLSDDAIVFNWIAEHGSVMGLSQIDLRFLRKEDIKNGSMTVYTYQQYLAQAPVVSSLVRLMLKRVNGSPRVAFMYSKIARPPSTGFGAINYSAQNILDELRADLVYGTEYEFETPELVILIDHPSPSISESVRAWKLRGKKYGESDSIIDQKLFFLDATTGEILSTQSEKSDADISGNVTGYATPGIEPDTTSNVAESVALEEITVQIAGGNSDDTDQDGDYVIVDPGGLPQNVGVALDGPRITVIDDQANDLSFTQAITMINDVIDFEFNSDPTEEDTSQVNAFYVGSLAYNFIRDRTLGILTLDNNIDSRVNMDYAAPTDPCNAAYIANTEFNFYRSKADCRNSAYSTVVAHEYGHHVVNELGLGQGAFGEGVGDTLAMLLYDTSGVGYDLRIDGDYLRNPVTADVQYPCGGAIHYCGQVLAGIFWNLRQSMGLSATQQLFVDWLVATAGGSGSDAAHPTTAVELLTIDDDNADLEDSTPHQEKICDALEAHGISCPSYLNFSYSSIPRVVLPGSTVTITLTVSNGLSTALDDTGIFFYRIDGGSWQQIVMTDGGVNVYTVDLPLLSEGQVIEYYFSAQTTTGLTVYDPQTSSNASYQSVAEYPSLTSIGTQLPRNPSKIISPEIRAGGVGRLLYVLPDASDSGFYSFTPTDFSTRDLIATRLPKGMFVGASSLFYVRTEASDEMVFTNPARTRVYYATKDGAGDITVDRKYCGDFQHISDIHLTEAGGVLDRLIVADDVANKVYSFDIDTMDSSLCVDEVSVDVTKPLWIRSSVVGASPASVYVGSKLINRLRVAVYNSDDLGMTQGHMTLSNHSGNDFGGVIYETSTAQLAIALTKTGDASNGDDHIRIYSADFSTTSTVPSCRTPSEVQQDHFGYVYVHCAAAKRVDVLDAANSFANLGHLSSGNYPKSMMVHANGVNRFVSILQTNSQMFFIQWPQAATNIGQSLTTSYLNLTGNFIGMGMFGVTDDLYLVSLDRDQVLSLDLTNQVVGDRLKLPLSIGSPFAESSSILHFISSEQDTAYSFQEMSTDNWRLRHYDVGDYPVQISYRNNGANDRLYVINRDSDSLSILDTGTGATVATISTQDRPVSMDWDSASNSLWVANDTGQSISRYDIDSTGPEAFVDHTAVGFRPKKLLYVNDGVGTVFVGGQTTVSSYNAANMAAVRSDTLPQNFTDMARTTTGGAGVVVSSVNGFDLHYVTRGATTQTVLDYSPSFLATDDAATTVTGFANNDLLYVNGVEFETNPFTALFANSTYFMAFEAARNLLRLYPIGLIGASNLPSFIVPTDIEVDKSSTDSAGNLWLVDSTRAEFLRIDPDLQQVSIENALLNRPVDVIGWDAKDRIYVALKYMNAVMAIDATDGSSVFYSVCQSPSELAIDLSESKLYVLCSPSESIAVVSLDGNGDPSGLSLIATDLAPRAMKVDDAIDRLFVVNSASDNVMIYDTTTDTLVTRATTRSHPVAINVDLTTDLVTVVSEASQEVTQFAGNTGNPVTPTYTDTTHRGLQKVNVNEGTGTVWAISESLATIYKANLPFDSANDLIGNTNPHDLDVSEAEDKTYILYPYADAVRVYDEVNSVQTDLAIGDEPTSLYVLDSANRVYIANYADDSISVIDNSGNPDIVTATVSLTDGCRPGQMFSIDVGGTVYLYIGCERNDTIEILNTTNNNLATPIRLRANQ